MGPGGAAPAAASSSAAAASAAASSTSSSVSSSGCRLFLCARLLGHWGRASSCWSFTHYWRERFLGARWILLPDLVCTVIRVFPILMILPLSVWKGLGFFIFTWSPIANSLVVSVGVVSISAFDAVGPTGVVVLTTSSASGFFSAALAFSRRSSKSVWRMCGVLS